MNKRLFIIPKILFFLICFSSGQVMAQSGKLKKQLKQAEQYFIQGKYAKAAELYENAWNQKSKKEHIYKAGECYLRMKDYRKAVSAFQKVTDDAASFPLANLFYGRSLKQDGQYDTAAEIFDKFLRNYKGAETGKRMLMAQNEAEGCQLGAKWENESTDTRIELSNPGEQINTLASEFAPIPFSDDILYYSSNMKGKSQLFRSQRKSGSWTPSIEPDFPKMPDGHVANGCFSEDNQRFYFTICRSDRAWKDIYSECDLYVIQRTESQWSKAEKLRDYIKMDGTTATHPHVFNVGNKEYLYYVTDRTGGKGGLDIWYTSRELNSGEFDFTLPQNAGADINTVGDETTPFYDLDERTLYFSSNGHVGIGGLDIFKATGQEESWSTPKNIGPPYNSSTNDYYYVKSPGNSQGFIVSNRSFGMKKVNTTDEDIFSFGTVHEVPTIKGRILADNAKLYLKTCILSLYEVKSNGQKRLLQNRTIEDGVFTFNLLEGRAYSLEGSNQENEMAIIQFDTYNSSASSSIEKDLQLQGGAMASNTSVETVKAKPPVSTPKVQIDKPAISTKPEPSVATETPDTKAASTKLADTKTTIESEVSKNTPDRNKVVSTTSSNLPDTQAASTKVADTKAKVESVVSQNRPDDSKTVSTATSKLPDTRPASTASSNTSSRPNNRPVSTTPPNRSTSTPSTTLTEASYNSRSISDGKKYVPANGKGFVSIPQGVHFKIQFKTVLNYNPNAPSLSKVKGLGRIDAEYDELKNWTRLLLADYLSQEEAYEILREVRQLGFPDAFLVKYRKGARLLR